MNFWCDGVYLADWNGPEGIQGRGSAAKHKAIFQSLPVAWNAKTLHDILDHASLRHPQAADVYFCLALSNLEEFIHDIECVSCCTLQPDRQVHSPASEAVQAGAGWSATLFNQALARRFRLYEFVYTCGDAPAPVCPDMPFHA